MLGATKLLVNGLVLTLAGLELGGSVLVIFVLLVRKLSENRVSL